jgi:DNA repair protein RadC
MNTKTGNCIYDSICIQNELIIEYIYTSNSRCLCFNPKPTAMPLKDYMPTGKITHWAEEDRPREKMLMKGKSALSDAELIAILLGSGTAQVSAVDVGKQVMRHAENKISALAKMNIHDLMKIKGIGEARAITIMAALELGRRRKEEGKEVRTAITSSQHAYDEMMPYMLDLRHEEFWILLLNRSNQIIKPIQVSSGGISGTVADIRIIFKFAIEHLASAIILVHNHPSGQLTPSQADKTITQQMKAAGKILELPILDHLIFSDHGFFSFADEGLL